MKLIRTISSAMRGPWARAPSKCRVPQWRGRAQEREYVCLMSSTTGCAMSDSKTRGACWGPTEQSKCVAEKISIMFSWFALFLAFYARQAVRHFSQMKHCSIKPCWKQNTLFSTSMKFNPSKHVISRSYINKPVIRCWYSARARTCEATKKCSR